MLFPGDPHEYHARGGRWIVSWFTFGGYHLQDLLKTIGILHTGIYRVTNQEFLEARIEQGLNLLTSSHSLKGLECSMLVYSFLLDLYKYLDKEDGSYELRHSRLEKVFHYVETHFSRPITVKELADQIHVTPQHFCILFKKAMHMRPFEYLNSYRINRSKSLLLQEPHRKIAEIAGEVGYENESYFSHTFRKLEGVSPRQFRDLNRIT